MDEREAKKQRLDEVPCGEAFASAGAMRTLDPTLLSKLHPHQKKGISFILKRLSFNGEGIVDDIGRESVHYTGAILADEMGTGKV